MNLIRTEIGEDVIDCMPYTDIVAALPKIYSDAKVVREFFDPTTYSDNHVIPLSTQLRRNYLFSSNIGQANVIVLL